MSNPVSLDFQISVQRRGKGAKKQFVDGKPKTSESDVPTGRVPRISRVMALAIHYENLIREGHVSDFAELARLGHVTRARVTQIMNLRLLAPDIQEQLLFLPMTQKGSDQIHLLELQRVAAEFSWVQQRIYWKNKKVGMAPDADLSDSRKSI